MVSLALVVDIHVVVVVVVDLVEVGVLVLVVALFVGLCHSIVLIVVLLFKLWLKDCVNCVFDRSSCSSWFWVWF